MIRLNESTSKEDFRLKIRQLKQRRRIAGGPTIVMTIKNGKKLLTEDRTEYIKLVNSMTRD